MAVTEQTTTARAREAARALAAASPQAKDSALAEIAAAIERRAGDIIDANRLDLEEAAGQRPSILDRLALDGPRTAALADAVRAVAALPDPIGSVVREFTLENGLRATKLRVPLGVVAIVYEARPNVTVDAAALCLKAGNACVLRGSSLARHTNTALLDVVREGIAAAGLPADAVQALGEDREQLEQFVSDPEAADVVIPRGGEELKKFLLAARRTRCPGRRGRQLPRLRRRRRRARQPSAITVNAKTEPPRGLQRGGDAARASPAGAADARAGGRPAGGGRRASHRRGGLGQPSSSTW